MYATGEGVEQSFTTAKAWFQKPAAGGHEDAIAQLKQMDEHISSTRRHNTGVLLKIQLFVQKLIVNVNYMANMVHVVVE